ncbi:hypothetical protein FACS1894152_3750 [Bacilli bacterium]|nr:hypothetical protein FACS1894152_3750 [Bacilli bacterium]
MGIKTLCCNDDGKDDEDGVVAGAACVGAVVDDGEKTDGTVDTNVVCTFGVGDNEDELLEEEYEKGLLKEGDDSTGAEIEGEGDGTVATATAGVEKDEDNDEFEFQ